MTAQHGDPMNPIRSSFPQSLVSQLSGLSRRNLLTGGAALVTAPLLAPGSAWAQDASASGGQPTSVITVDRARSEPIPIAIPALVGGDGGQSDQLGRDIAGVISNNLSRSGLFRTLDPAGFINAPGQGDMPNFQNWKAIGAQALVTGKVGSDGGDKVRVEFRLWDVLPGQQIQGTAYTTSASNWRRIAHIISDVIYERMLGEKGYFDTRIVYVAGTGPRDRRVKRLAIMDQDGENNRMLTDGRFLALTPRFHPTKDEIAFMSFENNRPRVYLFDLSSGHYSMLGDFHGMTLSPRFSPDGSGLLMAESTDSGSAIIRVDLGSRRSQRLTEGSSIDVSPCYSPDGSQIVFNSDRDGSQQLFIMGAGGGGAKRISYGQGRYATPVWSPRGDLIAFTRLGADTFAIGVMHPDGSGERILSESWYVEGPTFAPNGRVIMFWRESKGGGGKMADRLVSIDITGFNEREVTTPTDASDPAWSPLLS
jgi:TolB protein